MRMVSIGTVKISLGSVLSDGPHIKVAVVRVRDLAGKFALMIVSTNNHDLEDLTLVGEGPIGQSQVRLFDQKSDAEEYAKKRRWLLAETTE